MLRKINKIKLLCVFMMLVMLFAYALPFFGITAQAQLITEPTFEIKSEAVYLVNTDTDMVMYEKNANKKMYPAQLTNIMTVLVAIDQIKDIESVTVTIPGYIYDDFVGINVPHVDIKRGEKVTMEDLLYASLLRSASEASSAIADYVGKGSIPKFVDMMNEKAAQIGALNTTFKNANGLYEPKQVTTAYDMYLITKYAMENPLFNKIASTKSYQLKPTNMHKEERTITHSNGMMNSSQSGSLYYPYITGIKTASSTEKGVGRSIVSQASKNGQNYMLVTMKAPFVNKDGEIYEKNYSYIDQKAIYEWIFNSFSYRTYADTKNAVGEVAVKLGATQDYLTMVTKNKISILLPKDLDDSSIVTEIDVPDFLYAPIKKGDKVGMLNLKVDGQVIGKVELLASSTIERSSFLYWTYLIKKFYSNGWVVFLTILLVILIILYIMFLSAALKRAKKVKRIRRERQMGVNGVGAAGVSVDQGGQSRQVRQVGQTGQSRQRVRKVSETQSGKDSQRVKRRPSMLKRKPKPKKPVE